MRPVILSLILILVLRGPTVGSLPAQTPAPRIGHAMTSAGAGGGVFLFGGGLGGNAPRLLDSLWMWTGRIWRVLSDQGPHGRVMPAAAFDTRRGVLVVYGGTGLGSGTLYGDTWEWDGQRWEERNVRTPGPRDHHAMAYDEARGSTVMYGGRPLSNDAPFPGDTWTWDGSVWTRVDTLGGPGGVGHHAMAYDSRRQRVVMYGGSGTGSRISEDVYEWDGTHWERIVAEPGPGRRARHRMVYDPVRQVTVLYGGGIGEGPSAGPPPLDTWGWDGTHWKQLATVGPPVRYVHAMAWDARRHRVVMFGGGSSAPPFNLLGDLWEWDGKQWSKR